MNRIEYKLIIKYNNVIIHICFEKLLNICVLNDMVNATFFWIDIF